MRRRLALPLVLAAVAALVPAAAAPAADDRVIAPGVTAGGIDVGGQTIDAAAAMLDAALRPHVERDVVVYAGHETFPLRTKRAKLTFDALRTAKRAYYAGRDHGPGQAVELALTHARKRVVRFAKRVRRRSIRSPRNATMRITLTRVFVRRSRSGKAIKARKVARRISRVLSEPGRERHLRAKLRRVKPKLTARELRRRNGGTVLTVDRRGLKLRLFKRLRHRRTYGIAIGMAGFDTPAGRFAIQNKQVNPPWHAPNKPWAGSYAGRTVPGGAPNNPLKARWLGIANGVGIHGTAEEWSIGTRASHGCIRMRVRDVIRLYPRVPVGTAVLIR